MKLYSFIFKVVLIGTNLLLPLKSFADDSGIIPIDTNPTPPPTIKPQKPSAIRISYTIKDNYIIISSNRPTLGEIVIIAVDSDTLLYNSKVYLNPDFQFNFNGIKGNISILIKIDEYSYSEVFYL